jgi:hypothetical protein
LLRQQRVLQDFGKYLAGFNPLIIRFDDLWSRSSLY